MKFNFGALTTFAFALSVGSARADVIVVDAAGGGSFTQIQSAVDFAQHGDTILVKPGNYGAVAIIGKSLTVIGDAGAKPSISGLMLVRDLAADRVVTLARLEAVGLYVRDCEGAVRAVECDLSATPSWFAANLDFGSNVAFTGCTLRGADGVADADCLDGDPGSGWPALYFVYGRAALSECIVQGGDGGDGGATSGVGGRAVRLITEYYSPPPPTPSFMFAARSNIHGGAGGDTSCMDSGCPSSGGIAIYMNDALDGPASNPVGWLLDVMVGGGAPGNFVPGPRNRDCDPPEFGQTFAGDLTPFSFTAASLGFSIPSIAREGDLVTVTFTGPPGARVYLNDRTTTTFQAVASWRGVLLAPFASAGAPEREIKWGVIPSSGELKRTYPVPQLAPGEEAQTRFLQAYRVGPNGITLGTFRTLTVLDSSL